MSLHVSDTRGGRAPPAPPETPPMFWPQIGIEREVGCVVVTLLPPSSFLSAATSCPAPGCRHKRVGSHTHSLTHTHTRSLITGKISGKKCISPSLALSLPTTLSSYLFLPPPIALAHSHTLTMHQTFPFPSFLFSSLSKKARRTKKAVDEVRYV